MEKLIRKYQVGGYSTVSREDLKNAARTLSNYGLKALSWLGDKFNSVVTSGGYSDMGQTSPFSFSSGQQRRNIHTSRSKAVKKTKQKIAENSVYISPSSYIAALTQGSLNPKVGAEVLSRQAPEVQLLAAVGDIATLSKGPKLIKKTPAAVDKALAMTGNKNAKARVVAREIDKGVQESTKNGRIEVTNNYFNSPYNWYRISNKPEKLSLEIDGKNITTRDSEGTVGTPDRWRVDMQQPLGKKFDFKNIDLAKHIEKGTGENEGYFVVTPGARLSKTGSAHGNTSQASKGIVWQGSTSGSNLFPVGIIEGQAPLTIPYGKTRTIFKNTPWEEVPMGGRIGFHTGEMPMQNLGWFQRLSNGRYTYEPILGSKIIQYVKPAEQYVPTSLKFYERKPSLISQAEREGIPRGERNNIHPFHIAYYPGYQLKGLMKGSPLERQISKKGTININQLNAYFNKASQLEREVANKILNEKFTEQKTIDYNKFKQAIQNELIYYRTKPEMTYSTYGMNRLGFNPRRLPDGAGGILEFVPGVRTNTFTFESPRIPIGNSTHYHNTTLGHSRTYTTPDEPNILHVMESQSDWAQRPSPKMSITVAQSAYKRILKSITRLQQQLEQSKANLEKGLAYDGHRIQYEWERRDIEDLIRYDEAVLAQRKNSAARYDAILHPEKYVQANYLKQNYLQRQLQENLRYAAQNKQTKMRYPTPETAAKIEGYQSTTEWVTPEGQVLDPITSAQFNPVTGNFEAPVGTIIKQVYRPEHQTILKKYADFPKLFQKLYKGQNVRTVTDAKGNTWYEVDVPKNYLNQEWQYKLGGKII